MAARAADAVPPDDLHPAIQVLCQLRDSQEISLDLYKELEFKFVKMHQAFTQSCSTEQVLMRKCRDLDRELKSQKMTIESSTAQQQDHRTHLAAIHQFLLNIQVELDSVQDQIASTETNTKVKLKEAEKLVEKVEKAKEAEANKLEPQRRQIQQEVTDLGHAIQERREKILWLKQQSIDMTDRLQRADERLSDLERKKKSSNQKILEIGSIPVKMRQKCASVELAHNQLLTEEKSANQQLQSIELSIAGLEGKSHDFNSELQQTSAAIDQLARQISELRTIYDDLKKKQNEQGNVKQQREFDAKRIQRSLHEYDKEISNLDQKLDSIERDMERRTKETTKMEEAINRLLLDKQEQEGQLRTATQDKEHELEHLTKLRKQLAAQSAEKERALKSLIDLQELNEQMLGKIKEAGDDRDHKQQFLDQLVAKERDITQQLLEASLVRDRKAREMAAMKKKTVDAKALAMEKNLDHLDLCRKLESFQLQMREFSELYDKVKMDRNRHVNTIQTSGQLVIEMKEKINILESEVEVLRREYADLAFFVQRQKNGLSEAYKRRDSTRVALKQKETEYQGLQSKIDFQSNETNRMNHILQSLEQQINHQQERYTNQADDCADRQRMLVDKQDELCLIYEQFNRHEEIMRKGETALRERDEELKLLNLQLKDFARRIDIMQKKIPQLRSYNDEIAELERQLDRERHEVDLVTRRLEIPDQKDRLRSYIGKDFTLKELDDKVSLYEQRINSKEQQLWEKQILLREVEEKIAELSGPTSHDASKTQKIVERGGKIRADGMATHRKKLAALSEMAIYQAQKDELQEQAVEVRKEMVAAEQRTARGKAFDDWSARMARMHARDVVLSGRARAMAAAEEDEEDMFVRAGRQKFDAYPTADGLSRPYGAFPVFQPAPPPGYIRHYRKEGPRAIEI
jgi:chromosome segregation ATPase